MTEEKRKDRVHVFMLESEYQEFMQGYKSSTCRTKGSYVRKLLLGKPVTVMYRNRSLDDFIEWAVQLRKELKLIVSKDSLPDTDKDDLRRQLNSIEQNLIKIVDQCSQK
jgi:hypothetical protein